MRQLTDAERDLLVRRVAQSLCWAAKPQVDRDDYLYRARLVVKDLEAFAVSGATLKRACERVLTAPAEAVPA